MNDRNTCRIIVGRLIEVHVPAGYRTIADVDAMSQALAQHIESRPDTAKFVVAADWRRSPLLSPEVAARIVSLMSVTYERVERTGILHDPMFPTSALQASRVVNEARLVVQARRRAFTSATDMFDWLSEVLSQQEQERLREFLAANDKAGKGGF